MRYCSQSRRFLFVCYHGYRKTVTVVVMKLSYLIDSGLWIVLVDFGLNSLKSPIHGARFAVPAVRCLFIFLIVGCCKMYYVYIFGIALTKGQQS